MLDAAATLLVCYYALAAVSQRPETGAQPLGLRGQRVGVAPHDRPGCQLAPVAAQRRHLASNVYLHSPPDDISTDKTQQPQTVQSNGMISSPSVLSLDQQKHTSSPNNELDTHQQQQQKQATGGVTSAASTNGQVNSATGSARQSSSMRSDTSEKLRQLRQLLVSNNYDAYLVTPNDEHGSEYVSDYDRRLRFITGFTGSNGYALILLDRAVLFTDGRYSLQADDELDCNWWLVVSNNPLASIATWLKNHATGASPAGASGPLKVAIDARLMSLQSFDYLDEQLRKMSMEFVLISQDLVDVVWTNVIASNSGTSPATTTNSYDLARNEPSEPLFVHPLQFAGNQSWPEKVSRLTDLVVDKHKARHYVISQLDDIAWLLNLRGSDIPMSPLFKSYLWMSVVSPAPSQPPQTVPLPPTLPPVTPMTTNPSPPSISSMEQLLNAAASIGNGNDQSIAPTTQLPRLASTHSGLTAGSLSLQQPRVLQVQTNRFVRLILYVDPRKVQTQEVREHLKLDSVSGEGAVWTANGTTTRIQVELRSYISFVGDLRERLSSSDIAAISVGTRSGSGAAQKRQQLTPTGSFLIAPVSGRLLLDAGSNVAIHVLAKAYSGGDRLILVESLCTRLKSVKTDMEVEGMRRAHWRDSLAIAMLLAQLDKDICRNGLIDKWSETSAADELTFYRSLMDHNKGLSFDTISAYGPNAAVVHYRPATRAEEQELGASVRRSIRNDSTYLLDSGGQYLDGTTDITRTVHFGRPTNLQREAYTRVLMGAIDMMSLVVDRRAPTFRLNDLIARRHLFDIGLDYAHGTGHGIGAYSMVHEAPALIEHYTNHRQVRREPTASLASDLERPLPNPIMSQHQRAQLPHQQQSPHLLRQQQQQQQAVNSEQVPLQENMFTSVEPGYYKANEFGIRLENIVVTQRALVSANREEEGRFLRFEPLSLVPFEPKLIKYELLSNKQKAWLNSYNLMVRMRMTQQINHYLGKIRHYRAFMTYPSDQASGSQAPAAAASLPVRVEGTTASSRLYQATTAHQNHSGRQSNSSSFDVFWSSSEMNFLRMDLDNLQQKLAQTHRWIMDKTSLIALDIPIVLVSNWRRPQLVATNLTYAPALPSEQSPQEADAPAGQTMDWSGDDPIGQRLMLAYMSAAPFSDPEAALTSASLAARSDHGAGSDAADPRARNKCSGLECDLWLLEALNAAEDHRGVSAGTADQAIGAKVSTSALDRRKPPAVDEDSLTASSTASIGAFLEPLFQVNTGLAGNSERSFVPQHLWWMVGFAGLILVQLVIVAMFLCRRRRRGGSPVQTSGSHDRVSSVSRRADSAGSAAYSKTMSAASVNLGHSSVGGHHHRDHLEEDDTQPAACSGCTSCSSMVGRIAVLDE